MFDTISRRYDLTNDILTLGIDRLWRVAAVRAVRPEPGQQILDLAAGTGASSATFAARGAEVTAADLSEGMLRIGRERYADNNRIRFVQADATDLPFADNSFDTATISFGLRNMSDPSRVLREMARVVKPGGNIVVLEFSQPRAGLRRLYFAYTRHILPRIAGYIGGAPEAYEYLNESIETWHDQRSLASLMRDAGLLRVQYRNLSGGIAALHRGTVREVDRAAQARARSAEKVGAAPKHAQAVNGGGESATEHGNKAAATAHRRAQGEMQRAAGENQRAVGENPRAAGENRPTGSATSRRAANGESRGAERYAAESDRSTPRGVA